MYKRVYIAKDAYKSRYFVGSVEVTDFLFSKMSTVISTLLGCFKDIYPDVLPTRNRDRLLREFAARF